MRIISKKILAFNWKMNPTSLKEALSLTKNYISAKEKFRIKNPIIILPPFLYIYSIRKLIAKKKVGISLGAQNCFWKEKGAFSGEISPLMLKELGVKYIMLGHSERRKYFFEESKIIIKKALLVRKLGIIPIICWGEQNKKENPFVYLNHILEELPATKELILAYEPVWAIGSGKPVSPKMVSELHKEVLKILEKKKKIRELYLIYGGSVTATNITNFLKKEYIDGVLVGGASLKKTQIKEMFKNISKQSKR